jgi:aminotransferase
MKVHILGAGVAGLSCALAFSRRAKVDDVVVYERDSEESLPLRAGHGLILMQNGVNALRALDSMSILDGCTPIAQAIFQDEHGLTIRTDTLTDVYCVTRKAIVEGLRKQLPAETIKLNHQCERILLERTRRTDHQRVRALMFKNGQTEAIADGDLLIGADGGRSTLFRTLNPGVDRPLSRVKEIVTMTHMPDLAAQLGGRFIKTMFPSRGLAFGLLAPTATDVIGFLQFDSECYQPPKRHATEEDFRRFLNEVLMGAPEPVPSYLRKANLATAHVWYPFNAEWPRQMHCDNAVLIGDAAHPLLPFTSQGVAAAIEDAIILVDDITSAQNDPRAMATALRGFSEDRKQDVAAYVDGGRSILASFVDTSNSFAVPYVDGAASHLEEHLNLPPGSLPGIFRVLDLDGDGRIDRGEFAQTLKLFDIDISAQERESLFLEVDTDKSGLLELEEVVVAFGGQEETSSELLQAVRSKLSPRRLQTLTLQGRLAAAFRHMDSDKSGTIDYEEFNAALVLLGVFLSPEDTHALFERIDANNDGAIDFAELLNAVSQGPDSVSDFAIQLRTDQAAGTLERSELFEDEAVNLTTLRARAFNFRWAVHDHGVIPLTAADPDFPIATEIRGAMQQYIADGYMSYGPAAGLPDFRAAVANHFTVKREIPCTPGHIMATNSAASAMYLVAQFALQPGDEAIIANPVDFLFERSVVAAGGVLRRFRLYEERNWSFDPEEIESLVTPKTKLLSICNPHNPLGRVWSREELTAMTDIALRHNLWIMSDEVWADIVYAPKQMVSVAALSPEVAARTFTVYGFSKGYGLAGLRLGVLGSPTPALNEQMLQLAHADETAYGVSNLSQVAGTAALETAASWLSRFLSHLTRQRNYAVWRLRQMNGVRCHVPEGCYVVFPDVSSLNMESTEIVERLRKEHAIAVVPGSPRFFGPAAAGHLRISFATSRAILSEGLDRLDKGLAAIRNR